MKSAEWSELLEIESLLPSITGADWVHVLPEMVPPGVERRFDQFGGRSEIDESVAELLRHGDAAAILLAKRGFSEPSTIVSGLSALRAAHRARLRVIVAVPHFVSVYLVPLHLISCGLAVATFSYRDTTVSTREAGVHDSIAELIGTDAGAWPETILVPSGTAALEAELALRRGRCLLWPLDSQIGQSASAARVPFLGKSLPVATAQGFLRNESAVFLVRSRLEWRPSLKLRMEYLPLGQHATTADIPTIYGAAEVAIMENLDQWIGWRYYGSFGEQIDDSHTRSD